MVTSPSSVLGATRSFPTWWAVLLIIVGFLALALPFEAGVAIAIAVAILVIIAGVVHLTPDTAHKTIATGATRGGLPGKQISFPGPGGKGHRVVKVTLAENRMFVAPIRRRSAISANALL